MGHGTITYLRDIHINEAKQLFSDIRNYKYGKIGRNSKPEKKL